MGWGVLRGYERDGSNIHQYPSKEKRNRMGHTAHSDNRENSTTHQSSSSCQVQQGAKNRFHSCSEKGQKKNENLRL